MSKIVTVQSQQKWEYLLVTRKTEPPLLGEFNRLGQEGWEVIDVLYYKDLKGIMCWTGFLKRPSTGVTPMTIEQAASVTGSGIHARPSMPAPADSGVDLGGDDFKLEGD